MVEVFENELISPHRQSSKTYGENIHFSLSHKKLDQILEKANIYPSEERQRVYDILTEQMRKYKYLFK